MKGKDFLPRGKWNDIGERTTLSGDNSTFLKSSKEQLKVWFLEQALGWAFWIGRVGNDDVELILVVIQKLEAISNVCLDLWVLVADGHFWEILLRKTDHSLDLVNIWKLCKRVAGSPHQCRRE